LRLTLISLALAIAAAMLLLAYPAYSGLGGVRGTRATLVEVNGQWAIIPVALPVVVALVPVMFPHRVIRIIAAVVLGGFTALGAFSIGLFYLPAALAMAAGAQSNGSGCR
jgi:hypothetical protein